MNNINNNKGNGNLSCAVWCLVILLCIALAPILIPIAMVLIPVGLVLLCCYAILVWTVALIVKLFGNKES